MVRVYKTSLIFAANYMYLHSTSKTVTNLPYTKKSKLA
jgi:hypothetical protein